MFQQGIDIIQDDINDGSQQDLRLKLKVNLAPELSVIVGTVWFRGNRSDQAKDKVRSLAIALITEYNTRAQKDIFSALSGGGEAITVSAPTRRYIVGSNLNTQNGHTYSNTGVHCMTAAPLHVALNNLETKIRELLAEGTPIVTKKYDGDKAYTLGEVSINTSTGNIEYHEFLHDA